MNIKGIVPRAKPKLISAPKIGEPDSNATHNIIYNGPQGRKGVENPSNIAARFFGSLAIFSESRAKIRFAKGALGINLSKPNPNTIKNNTNIQGKYFTTEKLTNFRKLSPISPAKRPIIVNDIIRAAL